ncbi:hypothetical protein ABEB36_006652 [Hypothenemus hampei]|uniref:Uncharacterized protein n=1 Tax=Hypothenemus hampei TaxID=57062 RepID=A0ABD1ERS4_HYPHA
MYYSLEFVVCLFLMSFHVKAAGIKRVSVDIGKNLTIKCPLNQSKDLMWEIEGKKQRPNTKITVLENGSLFLREVDSSNSGIYSCIRENDVTDVKARINVTVRSPPPPLVVSIKPSTILVLVLWKVNGTGGYPIMHFTAQYRLAFSNNKSWIPITPNHIMPNSRQIEVYNLKPNTTYEFQMWATNQLGKSPIVTVQATTRGQYPESELARHLLKGAEQFDTRWWTVAVGVVLGTSILLGVGTCILLYQECKKRPTEIEPEIIELVPNIILNPGFEGPSHFNDITPDENYPQE